LLIEQGASVGGRLQTTVQDGFILDHGFQVIPSAYPELGLLDGLAGLNMRAFVSGADVFTESGVVTIRDHRSGLSGILSIIKAPVFTVTDLWRLARLTLLSSGNEPKLTGISTREMLERFGFSPRCIARFLTPFLAGILVDGSLSIDGGLARFYLRAFARGHALLPERGIHALPELLASHLGPSHIVLSAEAIRITDREVVLASGETLRGRRVICATDALRAAELGSDTQTMPFGGCATVYFSAPHAPVSEAVLCLNGRSEGLVNHVAVVSHVQPSYAPIGHHLISATVVLTNQSQLWHNSDLAELVLAELARTWFGEQTKGWRHLKTFLIPQAVPLRPRLSAGWCQRDGVFYAGDYLSYGSQNGALAAGRCVAREVLEGLGSSSHLS
jgi:hypothetical protein